MTKVELAANLYRARVAAVSFEGLDDGQLEAMCSGVAKRAQRAAEIFFKVTGYKEIPTAVVSASLT